VEYKRLIKAKELLDKLGVGGLVFVKKPTRFV
jgi:hypothetical protein